MIGGECTVCGAWRNVTWSDGQKPTEGRLAAHASIRSADDNDHTGLCRGSGMKPKRVAKSG